MFNLSRRTRRLAPACLLLLALTAAAADWSEPARQLARKIVARTGRASLALEVSNGSALAPAEVAEARRALEQALRSAGARLVAPEQAAATAHVTFSQNAQEYLWVAEIRAASSTNVVMTAIPRAAPAAAANSGVIAIRRQLLWQQPEPILDALLLEPGGNARLVVLGPERVRLLRRDGPRWVPEQELAIPHARAWPRDLRGRLVPRRDHLFDAFLPGVLCASSAAPPLALACRASDDPWPLSLPDDPPQYAPFTSDRNFFSGALVPERGAAGVREPFYSAAVLPRAGGIVLVFAGVNGAWLEDSSGRHPLASAGWGSDIAALPRGCAGPQVLATAAGDASTPDAVAAYDLSSGEPAAAGEAIEFSGPVTALWSAPGGAAAIAVSKDLKTGRYEAYSLTLACE